MIIQQIAAWIIVVSFVIKIFIGLHVYYKEKE